MIVEIAIGAAVGAAIAVYRSRQIRSAKEAAAGLPAGAKDGNEDSNGVTEEELEALRKKTPPIVNPMTDADDDEEVAAKMRKTKPRGLRVGDVLLYANSELWLAGGYELWEDGFVARIFSTPGNPHADYVVQLDSDASAIGLCKVTDEVPSGSLPVELPLHGERVRVERRGSCSVLTEGDLKSQGESAKFARFASAGGPVLFVTDFSEENRFALFGEKLGAAMFEVLPGDDDE